MLCSHHNYWIRSAIERATNSNKLASLTKPNLQAFRDTARLLINSLEFSEPFGQGHKFLTSLCERHQLTGYGRTTHGERLDSEQNILLWLLQLFCKEVKVVLTKQEHLQLLSIIAKRLYVSDIAEIDDNIIRLGGLQLIDAAFRESLFQPLHRYLTMAYYEEDVHVILNQGTDVFNIALDRSISPSPETPMSLAMYSFRAFRFWRAILMALETDTQEFVDKELSLNSSAHPEWDKKSLKRVFDHLSAWIKPLFQEYHKVCADCDKVNPNQAWIEPHWRHLLQRIKYGFLPNFESVAERHCKDPHGPKYQVSMSAVRWPPVKYTHCDSLKSDVDPHEYPSNVSLWDDPPYDPGDIVDMDCWLHFVSTGSRKYQSAIPSQPRDRSTNAQAVTLSSLDGEIPRSPSPYDEDTFADASAYPEDFTSPDECFPIRGIAFTE